MASVRRLPATDFGEEFVLTATEVVVGEFPFVRHDFPKTLIRKQKKKKRIFCIKCVLINIHVKRHLQPWTPPGMLLL